MYKIILSLIFVFPCILTAQETIDGKWGVQSREFNGTGCGNSIVALLDTGVETTHEQLSHALWTNPDEIEGDGIDNDNNGYVDDVHGIQITPPYTNIDNFGHGTHIAGVMFAKDFGIISDCKFISIKVTGDSDGWVDLPDATKAINYLIKLKKYKKLDTIFVNMSFAGTNFDAEFNAVIRRAIKHNLVLVAAAGNHTVDTLFIYHYPASLDGVVSVASIGQLGNFSWFSNYGKHVTTSAIGEGVLSSWIGNSYATISGTSVSTAHVTAVLARYYGVTGKIGTTQIVKYGKYNNYTKGLTYNSSVANLRNMVYRINTFDCSEKKYKKCRVLCKGAYGNKAKPRNKYKDCIQRCKSKYNCGKE